MSEWKAKPWNKFDQNPINTQCYYLKTETFNRKTTVSANKIDESMEELFSGDDRLVTGVMNLLHSKLGHFLIK